MNKKLLITVLSLVLLGGASFAVVKASAEETRPHHQTIIEKLVERFGLNQEEVEQLFDEVREERQAQMKAQHQEKLNALVEEGKITEEQKQAIIAKHEEMQAEKQENFGAWKDLDPEERRAKKQEHREEMQTWAEENGIDLYLLHRLGGRGLKGKRDNAGFGKQPFEN